MANIFCNKYFITPTVGRSHLVTVHRFVSSLLWNASTFFIYSARGRCRTTGGELKASFPVIGFWNFCVYCKVINQFLSKIITLRDKTVGAFNWKCIVTVRLPINIYKHWNLMERSGASSIKLNMPSVSCKLSPGHIFYTAHLK